MAMPMATPEKEILSRESCSGHSRGEGTKLAPTRGGGRARGSIDTHGGPSTNLITTLPLSYRAPPKPPIVCTAWSALKPLSPRPDAQPHRTAVRPLFLVTALTTAPHRSLTATSLPPATPSDAA